MTRRFSRDREHTDTVDPIKVVTAATHSNTNPQIERETDDMSLSVDVTAQRHDDDRDFIRWVLLGRCIRGCSQQSTSGAEFVRH